MNKEQLEFGKLEEKLKNPNTTLSEEELEDIRKKIVESLSHDRHSLLTLQPFTGGMLMRMELIPIRDYRCSTAFTDGSRIFFDMDFYKNLTKNERKFVLAHEIWHVIYMHFLRRQNRDMELWNIATDCEINYMLRKEGFKAPNDLCFPDPEDEGKSAEEIYESLLKKMKTNSKKSKSKQKDKNDGKNSHGNSSGGSGRLSGQFDKHMDKNGEQEKENNGNPNGENGGFSLPKDSWGEKGIDPNYTPRMSEDAAERIREMIISEAQRYERTCGTLPANLEKIINKLRNPTIPWQTLLADFVTSCYGDKRTWIPPNRRHVWSDTYLQSHHGEKIKVTVAVDTSGSTTGDLPQFMSEMVSLLEVYGNYEMRVIQCDMSVNSDELYDDCNPFPLENLEEFKWKGFGGTSFCPVFDKIEEDGNDVTCLIYFTDSYGDAPQEPPPYPVLWILTNDHNKDFCTWGQKIVMNTSDINS